MPADKVVSWTCPECEKVHRLKYAFLLDEGDCLWLYCPSCNLEYRMAVDTDGTIYSVGENRYPKSDRGR